jgi:hypothetical protein
VLSIHILELDDDNDNDNNDDDNDDNDDNDDMMIIIPMPHIPIDKI